MKTLKLLPLNLWFVIFASVDVLHSPLFVFMTKQQPVKVRLVWLCYGRWNATHRMHQIAQHAWRENSCHWNFLKGCSHVRKGDVPLSSEVLVSKWIMHVFCKDDIWWSYTVTENVNSGCELQYCQWSLVPKDKTTDIVIKICEKL